MLKSGLIHKEISWREKEIWFTSSKISKLDVNNHWYAKPSIDPTFTFTKQQKSFGMVSWLRILKKNIAFNGRIHDYKKRNQSLAAVTMKFLAVSRI